MLFGAILTLAFCGNYQLNPLQIENDKSREELFGAVKTVKTETALLEKDKDTWREGARQPSGSITFDEFGFKVEDVTFYAPDYAVSQKLINKYDKSNRIITIEIEGEGEKNYSYKTDGRQIEEVAQTKDNAVLYKSIYTFDKNGNNILTEYSEVDRQVALSLPHQIAKKFDAQNQLVEIAYFGKDATKTDVSDSEVHKVVISYDQNRKSQKSAFKADDSLFSRVEYNYDEKGNLTIATKFDSSSVPENKTTYSNFDKAGNWQKQLIEIPAETDKPKVPVSAQVTYRTLTYF